MGPISTEAEFEEGSLRARTPRGSVELTDRLPSKLTASRRRPPTKPLGEEAVEIFAGFLGDQVGDLVVGKAGGQLAE